MEDSKPTKLAATRPVVLRLNVNNHNCVIFHVKDAIDKRRFEYTKTPQAIMPYPLMKADGGTKPLPLTGSLDKEAAATDDGGKTGLIEACRQECGDFFQTSRHKGMIDKT
ncbi:hypothetical protein Q1695_014247 [Nippostrongylus brasiliensis]|nr:hypothetical protein Q1695_014247 [Nippostrongylus brasiliensis]